MKQSTKHIDDLLFKIKKNRWISLNKNSPSEVFDAKTILSAYHLIERQNTYSWKLTEQGFKAVELGGFKKWKKSKTNNEIFPKRISIISLILSIITIIITVISNWDKLF